MVSLFSCTPRSSRLEDGRPTVLGPREELNRKADDFFIPSFLILFAELHFIQLIDIDCYLRSQRLRFISFSFVFFRTRCGMEGVEKLQACAVHLRLWWKTT